MTTQYFKVTVAVAYRVNDPSDPQLEPADAIRDQVEEMFSYSDINLLDVCVHEQTLVDADWLESVLPDGMPADEDDEDLDLWDGLTDANTTPRLAPPSAGIEAEQPTSRGLDLTGIDPFSAEADDIREAHTEAITPDLDDGV